jgi:hypothetical protein
MAALGFALLAALSTARAQEDSDFSAQGEPVDAARGVVVVQGRYQIVVSKWLRADTFLLDTQTGTVWKQTQDTGSGTVGWALMPRDEPKP